MRRPDLPQPGTRSVAVLPHLAFLRAAIMKAVSPVFYDFCRIHKSLRVTPAMAGGIADHVWSVRELLETA
jgi:hypothetical protein